MSVKNGKESVSDDLYERELETRKKYRHVLPHTMKRGTDGAHANRLTVLIKCSHRGCKNTRRVATSDLFQVSRCLEHSTRKPKTTTSVATK